MTLSDAEAGRGRVGPQDERLTPDEGTPDQSGSPKQPPAQPDTGSLSDEERRRQKMADLAHAARERLPGDPEFGDSLSTSGKAPPALLARILQESSPERPSALKELGLGALQVFQSLSGGSSSREDREVAILFTDLVGFSKWALGAGDTMALSLLRAVDTCQVPAIEENGGKVIKRLGDGMMAAFYEPEAAVVAALRAQELTEQVEIGGHRPQLRAGVHMGTPRRIGGDYLGVDVNIAARVAAAARGDEVLISGTVKDRLEEAEAEMKYRRRRFFRAKGTPADLEVYSVKAG